MKRLTLWAILICWASPALLGQQVKILFDATKAETAGSADWVIDADAHNLGYYNGPATLGGGNESNAQRYPTPLQSNVTAGTAETYWDGALSAWGIDLVKLGYEVEELPYNGKITYGDTTNAQDLKNYKVFIVDEPNILFTSTEKAAMLSFVQNGGGLFMISDHKGSDRNNDGYDSPVIWNDFVNTYNNPFGITWANNDFSQTTTNIPNLPNDSLLHGPYGNVTEMNYSDGSSLIINPTKNSSVKGVVYVSGCSNVGDTGVMVCYARYGNGKVVGTGDSSPMDDGTGDPNDALYNGWTQDANGNHEKLIVNATIWLAETSVPVVADSLHLLSTADTTICNGASVNIKAAGATTYSWQPGGATTASITVQPTVNTTYIVAGTTGNTTKKDTVYVFVDQFNTSTPQITANGPLTFCAGGSVTLTAPHQSAYQWSTGANQQSIVATQSGSYVATVTDANGCSATSAAVQVTADIFAQSRPQLSANGPVSFCQGSNVVLSAPGGYTYQWNNSATQQTITVNQTGMFYATVTDANNCHAQTDTIAVSVSSGILNGVQINPAGPLVICSGNSLTLSAPAGYNSYQWNTGATQQSISVNQQGIYYVTVTAGSNCHGSSDTATVTADAFSGTTPQITVGGSLTFCQGDSVILSVQGGAMYSWSNNTTQASVVINQTGSYTVTITDASQCSAVATPVAVTVNALPQINFVVSPDSVCSTTGSLLLTASPTGGTFSGPGVSGYQFNPLVAGQGTFQIAYNYTDNNGCTNTDTGRVTVYTCLGIEEVAATEVKIYPNPSAGNFNYYTDPGQQPLVIRIFDEAGHLVLNTNGAIDLAGNTVIDMLGFANGMYIAEFWHNNTCIRKKLIKVN